MTIPSPMSQERLAEQLYEFLKDISLEDFVKLLTTEFDEIMEYYDLSHGLKGCMKMSLLFNPHRLDTKAKGARGSVYQALKHRWFSKGLARALLFKKGRVRELLYQVLQLGINGVQYINEFPPHVAAKLYRQYIPMNIRSKAKVLDPCAGWGGRMIGASTVVNCYEGFEPSTKTYEGLRNLFHFIVEKQLNPKFKAKIYCLPFEDATLPKAYYDFALTSPPYYDTEIYSDEETNSLNRYKTFEEWCRGFFFPLIQKTMTSLKPNATFILNIGDRKYPLSQVLLENFGSKYNITKVKSYLSQSKGGLGKTDNSGESFFAITHLSNEPKLNRNLSGFF